MTHHHMRLPCQVLCDIMNFILWVIFLILFIFFACPVDAIVIVVFIFAEVTILVHGILELKDSVHRPPVLAEASSGTLTCPMTKFIAFRTLSKLRVSEPKLDMMICRWLWLSPARRRKYQPTTLSGKLTLCCSNLCNARSKSPAYSWRVVY